MKVLAAMQKEYARLTKVLETSPEFVRRQELEQVMRVVREYEHGALHTRANGKIAKLGAAVGAGHTNGNGSDLTRGGVVLQVISQAGRPMFVSEILDAARKTLKGSDASIGQALTELGKKRLLIRGKRGLGLWGLPSMRAEIKRIKHKPGTKIADRIGIDAAGAES